MTEPKAGARSEAAAAGPVPWEDPERGRLPGFLQTLEQVLTRPAAFFARPAQGGAAEPFAFGLIMGTAGGLLALFWWLILLAAAGPGLKSALDMAQMAGYDAGSLALVMALTPLLVVGKLVLGGLCLWAAAALLGAPAGWAQTWRICCYATAGSAVAAIPLLGAPLTVLMTLFILHQGLQATWGMSGGRALGALAVFLGLQVLAAALLLGSFLALLFLGG